MIRSQFLLEAIALSVVGGLLGIGVGWLGAVVLPKLINQPVTLSAWASAGLSSSPSASESSPVSIPRDVQHVSRLLTR
ncbi:hypothetical protein GCM10027613_25010 [Microlunatus endophyticus]